MSAKKISVGQLADEIMDVLNEYKEVTDEAVESAVTKVSKETKNIAKSGSPVDSGEYQKGWAVKKTSEKAGKVAATVYNRKKPGLTHLLEKGHVLRNGGRASAKPHIAPAEDYAVSELESAVKRGIR